MIGARLKQARLLAGLTLGELADKLREYDFKITKQALSKYEREKSHPSAQFLLTASRVLDVPSTYFLHQSTKSVEWLAFRCRKRLSKKERNKIKAYASDIAELQIELRELLYPNFNTTLPSVAVSTVEDAEIAAEHLRSEWKVGDRPLDNLVQTAEDHDIVVVSWEDKTGLFDGLSARLDDRPITVINTNVPADRQRLSLAHEIGHLVLDVGKDSTQEETLAFRFAAALLVPEDHAFHELGRKRYYLDWNELESLKRKYGMSMSAWVRRAHDLEIINDSTYASMNRYLRSNSWHKDEPGNYLGDEEPIQLKQMAHRAVAEGLMSPDRISLVSSHILDSRVEQEETGGYPSATELLEMEEEERDFWMSKMFDLAEDMEFEVFEILGEDEL